MCENVCYARVEGLLIGNAGRQRISYIEKGRERSNRMIKCCLRLTN